MVGALKELLKRPVAYHPVLAKMLGSISAAVMLSQGMYWQGKADEADEEWFWVTSDGWNDQCGLTQHMQDTAREVLRKAGFWHEKRAGLPAKLYYKIDSEALIQALTNYVDSSKQDSRNALNKISGKRESRQAESANQDAPQTAKQDSRFPYATKERLIESSLESSLETKEIGPSIKVLEVSVFEPPRIDIIPLEENPKKEKKLKGRGPRKTADPETYEDRDVAKHLEKKEQVFFAEILNQGIWAEYILHRAGHKSKPAPYKSAKTCALQVRHFYEVSGGNVETAKRVLAQSERLEWLDLYPIKNNNNGRQNGNGITNGIAAQDFRKEFFFGGVDFPTK